MIVWLMRCLTKNCWMKTFIHFKLIVNGNCEKDLFCHRCEKACLVAAYWLWFWRFGMGTEGLQKQIFALISILKDFFVKKNENSIEILSEIKGQTSHSFPTSDSRRIGTKIISQQFEFIFLPINTSSHLIYEKVIGC